jgi:hypothetical protein
MMMMMEVFVCNNLKNYALSLKGIRFWSAALIIFLSLKYKTRTEKRTVLCDAASLLVYVLLKFCNNYRKKICW